MRILVVTGTLSNCLSHPTNGIDELKEEHLELLTHLFLHLYILFLLLTVTFVLFFTSHARATQNVTFRFYILRKGYTSSNHRERYLFILVRNSINLSSVIMPAASDPQSQDYSPGMLLNRLLCHTYRSPYCTCNVK